MRLLPLYCEEINYNSELLISIHDKRVSLRSPTLPRSSRRLLCQHACLVMDLSEIEGLNFVCVCESLHEVIVCEQEGTEGPRRGKKQVALVCEMVGIGHNLYDMILILDFSKLFDLRCHY